jgi:hypothetical protein
MCVGKRRTPTGWEDERLGLYSSDETKQQQAESTADGGVM